MKRRQPLNTLVQKPTLTETIDHTTFLKVLDVSTKAVQRPIMKRTSHHGLREKTFADNMKLIWGGVTGNAVTDVYAGLKEEKPALLAL
jgi:adenylate kinase family enzyme